MDYTISFAGQLTPHLRALRRSRGLTQAQLGSLMGLSQARIADIEKIPGVVGVEQILEVLNTLGAKLVIRTDTEPGTPGAESSAEPPHSPKGSW